MIIFFHYGENIFYDLEKYCKSLFIDVFSFLLIHICYARATSKAIATFIEVVEMEAEIIISASVKVYTRDMEATEA